MAFQSEIELRVKVIDKELNDLEKRIAKVQNPTNKRALEIQRSSLQVDKNRIKLAQRLNVERVKELNLQTSWYKVLKEGQQVRKDIAASAEREAAATKKAAVARAGRAVGGALISGAFPILTGGGELESILGGVGGALGALFGPGGSFAGGIAGSAIGRIISDTEDFNKQLAALNVTLSDTQSASDLTGERISALAQELSLAKEDVVELAKEFSGLAVGEQVGELTRVFGPVGGAGTFEALAQARLSEKDTLEAIQKLQPIIGLETAKRLQKVLQIEGSQAASVALLDAVLDKSKELTTKTQKVATLWDQISAAVQLFAATSTNSLYGPPTNVPTAEDLAEQRAAAVPGADRSLVDKALKNLERYYKGSAALREKYGDKGERSRSKAADEELRVQKALAAEAVKQFDIETKVEKLSKNKIEAIEFELSRLDQRTALQRASIIISTEDARLQDAKLQTLDLQTAATRKQLELNRQRLLVEREVNKLRKQQRLENLSRTLTQELVTTQTLPTGNTFADERTQLLLQQDERRISTLGRLNQQLAIQNKYLTEGTEAQKTKAAIEIPFIEKEIALYEKFLPQIAAAEEAQLRFNQALSLAQGPVNAAVGSLLSGLQAVTAGTKSAEEAFADFLNSIANQLIQTAATMIAQYIAIGIARQFAGVPAPSSGFTPSTGTAPGLNFFEGLPGLASGGPATAGKPYIVGERGPELFVPGRSGTVVPNDAMGGQTNVSVVVNTDGNSTASSNGNSAQEMTRLAKMIESSTMQIINREKRPGGVLSR